MLCRQKNTSSPDVQVLILNKCNYVTLLGKKKKDFLIKSVDLQNQELSLGYLGGLNQNATALKSREFFSGWTLREKREEEV